MGLPMLGGADVALRSAYYARFFLVLKQQSVLPICRFSGDSEWHTFSSLFPKTRHRPAAERCVF